ncbi:MAG: hypothetical protein K2X81_25940, partial [Candidatus Obscuribacterales bacterium]|nr:hypothetical protein [Candidatus Obscuribacterales bacterium]
MTRLHHKTGNTRHKQRNMSGSMVAIMAGGILIAVFTVGVLSLDIAHNVTTRTALQNAADAAALAGATVLVNNNVQSTVDGGVQEQVKQTAIDRAGSNSADGHPVSTAAGVTLNPNGLAYVIPPNAPGAGGVSDNNGQCQVGADVNITNMFAGIIGHPKDKISVQSVATAYTSVVGVNQNTLFPIAVSLDTQAGHDALDDQNKPLNLCKLGDHVIFYLKEPCANAAWTTYNTGKDSGNSAAEVNSNAVKYINKALDSVLGSSYTEGLIPAQSIGQDSASGGKGINGGINLLGDISGTKDLTKLLKDKTIVLPIVAGDLPFWNLDKNGEGSQHAPGAGQTR